MIKKKIGPAELKWRSEASWEELMYTDLKKMGAAHIPDVWKEAALYHTNHSTKDKVKFFRVLAWNPTSIQTDTRMVEEADIWCSATIGGEPYGVLAQLGKESVVEFYPGNTKDMQTPWS